MKIQIERQPDGLWTVHSGERYQDNLALHEVLDVLARVLYLGEEETLRTPEEHRREALAEIGFPETDAGEETV